MDGENVPLIGAHGYCSQEMVNLLLTGRAVSNTFDGHITLSESGISRASDENYTTGLFYIVHEFCFLIIKILYKPSLILTFTIFYYQRNVATAKHY